MVVVSGDWSVQTLLLPLDDVLEGNRFIPDGVGDKAILVGEGPNVFVVNISSRETQIWEFLGNDAIWVKVRINSRNSFFVRPVKFSNGVPDLALYFEIMLKVLDNVVISLDICFVMVLIKLRSDVLG
jgi:hypothetical protein